MSELFCLCIISYVYMFFCSCFFLSHKYQIESWRVKQFALCTTPVETSVLQVTPQLQKLHDKVNDLQLILSSTRLFKSGYMSLKLTVHISLTSWGYFIKIHMNDISLKSNTKRAAWRSGQRVWHVIGHSGSRAYLKTLVV